MVKLYKLNNGDYFIRNCDINTNYTSRNSIVRAILAVEENNIQNSSQHKIARLINTKSTLYDLRKQYINKETFKKEYNVR